MEMTPHAMTHQLIPFLKRLRLSGILETLDARNEQAIADHWTYVEFLARLLEDEVERRAQKQLALRIRRAAINTTKTLEGFDFNFNPTVNRQQVLDLSTCSYIRQKRNVLICGPTGVGKTHVAQALAHEACRRGYTALCVNTYRMLQHINGGRADDTLERRLQTYLRPDLLVLDDFGLKALHPPAPEDLYDVINERYERGSILLTSNRDPQEWLALFGDSLLASAGLDRLMHSAHIVIITGVSFRTHTPPRLKGEVPTRSSEQR
jgi:DNA replication protein DnaC